MAEDDSGSEADRGTTDARLAPNLPGWMLKHANRYLGSGGVDGHMYKITPPGYAEMTVPSLLGLTPRSELRMASSMLRSWVAS